MPVNVPQDEIVRVVIEGVLDQQICQNVWHFVTDSATTLEAIENEVNDNIISDTAEFISNEFSFSRVSVQGLHPNHTDPYEEGKSFAGQHAGVSLPVANAIVVALKSGIGGRKNRGRKYFPGVVESEVDNSRVDADYKTLIQTTMNNLNLRYQAGGAAVITWGIYSPVLPNGNPGHHFVSINSVIVRDVLGTMRSRLPGHGR